MKFEKIKGPQNHHLFKPYANGVVRDVIWVRFFKAGKGRLEESLKTNILGAAREERDKRIAEFLGEKPRRSSKVLLVEEKFPEFLELKKIKAKATFSSYNNQWENHLKPHFGGMIVDELTESEWSNYVKKKRETDPGRKFFNDWKCLIGFANWLHRNGFISKLPKLQNPDPEVAEGKVYSEDQVRALLKHSDKTLKLQILLALTMGMRIGEIMSLETDQIDFVRKTIHLPARKTKIRRERTFGISDACLPLLKEAVQELKGMAVFPSPGDPNKTQGRTGSNRAWTKCKRLAEIPSEYRFHWLRHTFLTRAFKKAVNPALICEYAGLSLEIASQIYLHFTPEDTRVVSTLIEVPL